MQIEVKLTSSVYVKAFVNEILPVGIRVSYENFWSPNEVATYDRCRIVFSDRNCSLQASSIKINDIIEAYIKQNNEIFAWQEVKVKDIKGDFLVVESVKGPTLNEILSADRCRLLTAATPLNYNDYKEHLIKVPEQLETYFENSQSYKELRDLVKDIHIDYLKESCELRIGTFSSTAIRSVKLVTETFLNNAKQKKILLDRQEEAKQLLLKNEKTANVVEEFNVPACLMGLAIGAHGGNITNVRKIDGIEDIIIDESQKSNGVCVFKIMAKSENAAIQARNMLEFDLSTVSIPRNMVGQVIGKNGRNVQDIVNKSGVVRVKIEDPKVLDENLSFVNFNFTGTKESINNAKLLIQMHLNHLKEMEEMRGICDDLNRKLYHRFSPVSNSHSINGNYSKKRNFDSNGVNDGQPNRYRNGSTRNKNKNNIDGNNKRRSNKPVYSESKNNMYNGQQEQDNHEVNNQNFEKNNGNLYEYVDKKTETKNYEALGREDPKKNNRNRRVKTDAY